MSSNSGVSPTASATANKNDSKQRSVLRHIYQQGEQHHHQRQPYDQHAKLARAQFERGGWCRLVQVDRNLAYGCGAAGATNARAG
jgi:hypothetical protein